MFYPFCLQQRCDLIDSVEEQDVYDAAEEVGQRGFFYLRKTKLAT